MVELLAHVGDVLMNQVDGLSKWIGGLTELLDRLAELCGVNLGGAGALSVFPTFQLPHLNARRACLLHLLARSLFFLAQTFLVFLCLLLGQEVHHELSMLFARLDGASQIATLLHRCFEHVLVIIVLGPFCDDGWRRHALSKARLVLSLFHLGSHFRGLAPGCSWALRAHTHVVRLSCLTLHH